jgi:hypothetical protein
MWIKPMHGYPASSEIRSHLWRVPPYLVVLRGQQQRHAPDSLSFLLERQHFLIRYHDSVRSFRVHPDANRALATSRKSSEGQPYYD